MPDTAQFDVSGGGSRPPGRRERNPNAAALRAAVEARAAVPAAFIEAGRNAYAWHNIDAELAGLSYDSLRDAGQDASVRSEAASVRALTFQSARFSIEVELTDDALIGQLIPPQPGTAELQTCSGQRATAPVDDVGCFTLAPRPDGPFRLRCRTVSQADVRTGWVAVTPGEDSPLSHEDDPPLPAPLPLPPLMTG